MKISGMLKINIFGMPKISGFRGHGGFAKWYQKPPGFPHAKKLVSDL
jgi:hypothetical protein